MAATAEPSSTAGDRIAREEERLARAAARGDGHAFAALYERYETRAYNLAYRVTGSAENAADATQDAFVNVMRRLPEIGDRDELNFGSYLFTATRNACYDLMRKQQRSQPTDEIPETATPVGSSSGGILDPGDPDDDPDRNVLVKAQQEEIREANSRLPDRQREALALFELEDMSYDEVADVMEMNRNSVAQLISRARLNLRDELRGTALASITAATPDCERALPLLALSDDRQLDPASDDSVWLAHHIAECNTCRLSREAMEEAGRSYRAWIPVAAAPLLFRETMAKAAEAVGADWSDVIAHHEAARGADAAIAQSGGSGGAGGSGISKGAADWASGATSRMAGAASGMAGGVAGAASSIPRPSRRTTLIASGVAALLLVGGFAIAGGDSEPDTSPEAITPAADVTTTPLVADTEAPKPKKKAKKAAKKDDAPVATTTTPGQVAPTPVTGNGQNTPVDNGNSGGGNTNTGGGGGGNTQPPTGKNPTSNPTPPADNPPTVDEPPVVSEPTDPTNPGRCPTGATTC